MPPPTAALALAQPWAQSYDPAHHWLLSAVWAALPLLVLLIFMGGLRLKGRRIAALAGMAAALLIALLVFRMPASMALLATGYGAAYGLFPVCWIVFPVLFMYQLITRAGRFMLLQDCLLGVTADSRLQLVLIAFSFGAFFEGVAGFGTPVAVCGTLLIGLGFAPLEAASLALLANTAPVAFGALGLPLVALHGVTGLDTLLLGRVTARIIAPFCFIVPFWLVWAFAGFSAMLEVWPALLVAGRRGIRHLTRSSSPRSTAHGSLMFSPPLPASSRSSSSFASGSPAGSGRSGMSTFTANLIRQERSVVRSFRLRADGKS